MTINKTVIPGCFELVPSVFYDERGCLVKTFHKETFEKFGLNTDWKEEFYTVSRKGIIRGLHFQLPPHDHVKLVYCIRGSLLDAVVDLRKGSPMYGKHLILKLCSEKANMLYIPRGLAHGFYALSDIVTVMYKVSSLYASECDSGILWNSVGIMWPDENPLISQRDKSFSEFKKFESPFDY